MAVITVSTTLEERKAVLAAVGKHKLQCVPMTIIAQTAGLTVSRARYAMADLVDNGHVAKVVAKATNAHYIRYSYEVTEKPLLG